MIKTWASGAIELLDHAEGHMKLNTAFDKKMAFISIDNAVENAIKTFLKLPKKILQHRKPTRKELQSIENSFPGALDLLEKYASDKLAGIDINDIEHFHRIRNVLYHAGTGLTAADSHLKLYYEIAKILVSNLFNLKIPKAKGTPNSRIEDILIKWNKLEKSIIEFSKLKGHKHKRGILTFSDIKLLEIFDSIKMSEYQRLKSKRNELVHSTNIDKEEIKETDLDNIDELNETVESKKQSLIKEYKSYYYGRNQIELTGKVEFKHFYGPPNYGETPSQDKKLKATILKLSEPVNIIREEKDIGEGDFDISYYLQTEIQLMGNIPDAKLLDTTITVKGKFYGSYTGYHQTKVILEVETIIK